MAMPLAAAILGFLAVLAAAEPSAIPRRESSRLEMVDLIGQQDDRVRVLREEVRDLEERVRELGSGELGAEIGELRAESERLAVAAGASPLRGPGLTVVLEDSSASRSASGNPDDLIVHERDIQAVVNALWAAGAEAVAINGERLSSLSAVRCAGNTLLLHGVVHSPPYEIRAIGDPVALETTLAGSPRMRRLLDAVSAFGLGLAIDPGPVVVPRGRGVRDLARAAPVA
jgi:uncharacterized protein YlxW (UPF0749 family)